MNSLWLIPENLCSCISYLRCVGLYRQFLTVHTPEFGEIFVVVNPSDVLCKALLSFHGLYIEYSLWIGDISQE